MTKCVTMTITGKVQNVGFRYNAVQTARQHRIKGFVRNQPDGSVYIEAEGKETDLDLFIEWCKVGPSWGRIDNVQINEIPMKNYTNFSVVY